MATSDRSAYPRFPLKISPQELAQQYIPSPEELQWAQAMSREHRLRHTALVLLKCVQQLHYFPELDQIPLEISQHIAQVMGLGVTRTLALSAATRYRQETAIRRYLGITPFYGTAGRRMALHAARAAAPLVTQRVDLINAIIDALLRGRVELPAYSTLVQIAEDVACEGETDLIELITSRLNEAQRRQLDHLLHTDLDRHRSAFDRLKRVPKRPSRDHLDTLIEQSRWLDAFGEVDELLVGIPYLKRRYYANYALALDARDLKDLLPAKRYTLILTMIQHLRVSADGISPHITELKSPLNTESQCPFTAHQDGGGTDAAQGGLHDDSGIGSTWALSL